MNELRRLVPTGRCFGSGAGIPLPAGRPGSANTASLRPRTDEADKVVQSVCPYCAVGCGQRVYVKDGAVTQIEGDPDSPISAAGSAQRVRVEVAGHGPAARAAGQVPAAARDGWQELDLDEAMEMIADRIIETRRRTWQWRDDEGRTLRRSLGVVSLGGATFDNEENYCIKKLMTSLGFVTVENQARI